MQFDLFTPYPPKATDPNAIYQGADARSETAFTPKFGLQYEPRMGLMFFANVSKGFKSGGFNIGDGNGGFARDAVVL